MPIKSNAVIRVRQTNEDGSEREDRIFKKPDGSGFNHGCYDDEETPDDRPQDGLRFIPMANAALIIRLLTTKYLDDEL